MRFAVLVTLLFVLVCTTASGQVTEAELSLATVRDQDRTHVVQLVNNLVAYQRSQQWGSLFDLFSPTQIRPWKREDYVKQHEAFGASGQAMYMLDFILKRVLVNDPFDGQYSFAGCANVFRDGKVQFTNAHIDLILERDLWRVAEYGMFASCQPPELECKE